jgi:hypothetical protein
MKQFLTGILTSIAMVLAPIKGIIITVGILIFADMISGVAAARKRGEKISSARLRDSITKCLIYQVAIITGFLVQQYLLQDFIPIVKIVASLIGMVELKSLYENLDSIHGGDLFNRILDTLGSKNKQDKE